MRFNKTAAILTAALTLTIPAMQAAASETPVYEYFNPNDINGAVRIVLPKDTAAHVEITFDSPEGLAEPYYVTDIKGGETSVFNIEGRDEMLDGDNVIDYRLYHISITLSDKDGKVLSKPITNDFTVHDPDSLSESGTPYLPEITQFNFTASDEFAVSYVQFVKSEVSVGKTESVSSYDYTVHSNVGMLGDVNGDGAVDGTDATLVLKEYALVGAGSPSTFTELQRTLADTDKSSSVDGSDATRILKYYALAGSDKNPDWDNL